MAAFRSEVTQGIPGLRYPEDVGQPPFEKFIMFEARAGRHVLRDQVIPERASGLDRLLGSVALYLDPSALNDALEITYGQHNLGTFVGAAVEYLAQTGDNLFNTKFRSQDDYKSAGNAILKAVGKLGGDASETSIGDVAELATEAIKADLSRLVAGEAMSVVSGQRANPRTDILFETQQYRTHQYGFTLIPRSLKEAQAIDRIINFFQYYMLPSYNSTALTEQIKIGSFMIGFPYEFTIQMAAWDGRKVSKLDHVTTPGRCVLRSFGVNHAAGGKTAFVKHNGEYYPVATKIDLQFMEVRLLGRDSAEIQRPGGIDPADTQKNRQD